MTEPANREAIKQQASYEFGAMRAGIPLTVWEKLPWPERFFVRWENIKDFVTATLPRHYFQCCLQYARTLEHTQVWLGGPNVVVRTKARAK